jgi:glycosyltransferase involved in cell wall biosynthesis
VDAKPELLYVCPVVPNLTGNGLAMRAGMVLEALAGSFSISLLVIELYAAFEKDVPAELGRLCRRITIVPPADTRKTAGAFLSRLSSRWFGPWAAHRRARFDVVHVFRLATLPQVRSILRDRTPQPELHLDLDDIESTTHGRLAALCRSNGDLPFALFEESEARRYQKAEEEAFQEVDRIYVCSEPDKTRIERRSRARVCVLPNAVRFPGSLQRRTVEHDFRFLFIGTLGYYPNEDAALYFCREMVPLIRKQSSRPVNFDIVGDGASRRLRKIAGDSGVSVVGPVASVAACYESAAAVVVPLRAGGGTRIKILEAFSYQRPVVSTSIGAEGLDVRDGQEILIADTPEAFARACVRLVTDRDLRELLTGNAFQLALQSYSLDTLRRAVMPAF